jgi:mannose-6-phosphate isomerase-like protein (cupin superfamily)
MTIKSQLGLYSDIVERKSEKIIKKWGFEEILINNSKFCGKILHYNNKGSISSFHLHPIKTELFRCISGAFMFRYKNAKGFTEETRMNIGDSVYIPNCQPHQLESLEDNSEILEISTYHNDLDVIRIEPGDSQK